MIDSKNPETIEIHGYSTIHKLCKFAADRDMEGCTFTDIVDRALNEINALKAQLAKFESGEFVVVPKSKLNTCYWDEANNSVGYYELFDTLEEAKKAAAHYKATIKAGY